MAAPVSTEDCYFFLYSTCKRGSSCAYRHNPFSRLNPVLCEEWNETRTCREDCPFRHSFYHLQKKRSDDLCYWEDKPEGCTKEFCEFKHRSPEKDAWKQGGVKSLSQIRKEKNIIRKHGEGEEQQSVDMESFEKERREKRRDKLMKEKAKAIKKRQLRAVPETVRNDMGMRYQPAHYQERRERDGTVQGPSADGHSHRQYIMARGGLLPDQPDHLQQQIPEPRSTGDDLSAPGAGIFYREEEHGRARRGASRTVKQDDNELDAELEDIDRLLNNFR